MPDAHLSPVHGCENGMEQYPHREKENILEGKAAQPENGARL